MNKYKAYRIETINRTKSTEKAWLMMIDGIERWIPKSQCRISDDGNTIMISEWFANRMDQSGAMFSDDKKSRFVLWRTWNESKKTALVIGLNPSTANENTNDPTIDRLGKALAALGYGGFRMVNVFTIISSKPEVLMNPEALKDEQMDLGIIFGQAILCQEIIFGWGAFKEACDRTKKIIDFFPDALCFGKNKDGTPWHPMACMYAGLKPEATRLFKFRDHHYDNNIYAKKSKKSKRIVTEKSAQQHTQPSLFTP